MQLSSTEVHLWCAYDEAIDAPELLDKYRGLLDRDELDRQQRFRFRRNRHQFLVTRALVRSVLAMYLPDLTPTGLSFGKNAYGKPYVTNPALRFPLEFNLSHSEKLIVLAVSNGLPIGVDVEYRLRDNKTLSIADRFFSPSEATGLRALPVAQQQERFFDLWTLKEAYIKARGQGLSIPLDKFSFRFPGPDRVAVDFDRGCIDDDPAVWRFWQLVPNPTHRIAIAALDRNGSGANAEALRLEIRDTVPLLDAHPVAYPVLRTG